MSTPDADAAPPPANGNRAAPQASSIPMAPKVEAAEMVITEAAQNGGKDGHGEGDGGEGESTTPTSAKERAKWLQEQAFKGSDTKRKVEEMRSKRGDGASGTSAKDRAKWLQEQAFKGSSTTAAPSSSNGDAPARSSSRSPPRGEGSSGGGTSAKDRAKWLQEQAFKSADDENRRKVEEMRSKRGDGGGGTSAKDRAKWLQEQAFKGSSTASSNVGGGVSSNAASASSHSPPRGEGSGGGTSAKDRAKWLAEKAFNDDENKKRADEYRAKRSESVSMASIAPHAKDRTKWLQKGENEEDETKKSEEAAVVAGGSAKDKARWLQEEAFKGGGEGGVDVASGAAAVVEDKNEAQDEGEGEKEKEKVEAASSATPEPSSGKNLVADRMKWLQDQGSPQPPEKEEKVDAAEIVAESAKEKEAEWLRKQGEGDGDGDGDGDGNGETEGDSGKNDGDDGEQQQQPAATATSVEGKKEDDDAAPPPDAPEKETDDETTPRKKSVLVADKMKWISEQGKETTSTRDVAAEISSMSRSTSAREKAKWLQEQASLRPGMKKEEGEDEEGGAGVGAPLSRQVSQDAVSNRAKWIQQQGKDVVTSKGVEIASSNVSDRMKWLSQKVNTYQAGVTRESDVVQASSGKLKFVLSIASNARDAPAKFKAVPHEAKIENVAATVSEGLVEALKTNFANGQLYVVRDVCSLMKELIPFRFIRKNPGPVAALANALLKLNPPPEVLERAKTTKEEVVGKTALAVAPLLAIVGREDENLPSIAPRYMRLLDRNIAQDSMWKEVADMAPRDPESISKENKVICRAIREREDVPQWEKALGVLSLTARYNIDPVREVVDDLVELTSSSAVTVTAVAGILLALAETQPEAAEPFLSQAIEELDGDVDDDDDDGGCAAVLPLLAVASKSEAVREKTAPVLDKIEGDMRKYGSAPYVADSSVIVRELSTPDGAGRCLGILLQLAEVQKESEECKSGVPLSHYSDVYRREDVPRDIIDGVRSRIEWFRDESTDEAAKTAASDILDYRDDSSVVVKELFEGDGEPSAESVTAALTTLLGLAEAQDARRESAGGGGVPSTPLTHFGEAYQRDCVPRDIIDGDMRTKLEWFRDECSDEKARAVASDILDYRDDSSVVVRELLDGGFTTDDVTAALTTLLDLADARDARDGGVSPSVPLVHFGEAYRRDDVPRDIVDPLRPRLERFRDECKDEEARAVASEILHYRDDSSVIVRELFDSGRTPTAEDVKAAIGTLLDLTDAQNAREGGSPSTPLGHLKDAYQRDGVPRDIIDDVRPKIEWYRDECTNVVAKAVASDILNYRDDSSVIVRELFEGDPGPDEVTAALTTLLGLAEAQDERAEGGGGGGGASPSTPLTHFKEIYEKEWISYDIVDGGGEGEGEGDMRPRLERLRDSCSEQTGKDVAASILKLYEKGRTDAELKKVKDYVTEHAKEMKVYIGTVAATLPMPVMFASKSAKEEGTAKKMSLYFECCDKVDGCLYPGRAPNRAFVSETKDINEWLKVAVAAVLVDVAEDGTDDLSGVGAVKKAWDAAHDAYDGDFQKFVSEPYLSDAELENLVNILREDQFYDQFKYWAPKGGWRCATCHQKEQLEKQRRKEEEAAAESPGARRTNNAGGVLVMGMIERRSGKFGKKWKKQLVKVIYDNDTKQIQYDDPQNAKKHGGIEIAEIVSVDKEERGTYKQEYVFSVKTDKKIFHFATRNMADLDTWVSILNGCIERLRG